MSTTLERLENAEKTVAQLQASVAMLQGEAAKLNNALNQQGNNTMQYLQFILQKISPVEQSLMALSKVSDALVNELVRKSLVSNEDLETQMRLQNENEDKKRIKTLLEAGSVKSQEAADDSSLVVFAQETEDAGKKKTVGEYRIIELGAKDVPQDIRDVFAGKKAGEQFNLPIEGSDMKNTITVLEVYGLTLGAKEGEAPAQEAAAEAAPAQEAQQ